MTVRSNCVEYAYPMLTGTLAAATYHTYTPITVTIPETGSRTWLNCYVEVYARDAQAATASRVSMASWIIGINFNAGAHNDVTVTDTITDSGEQLSYQFARDVTARFTAEFGAGTSQTVGVRFQFTGAGVVLTNLACKLVITYSYEDTTSGTTRVKTIRIPIESNTGPLTTTLANIGTNQIPALNTFCPEATKTFTDSFFELFCNSGNVGATDCQLGVQLDTAGEVLFGIEENANISACFQRYIWKPTIDPALTHNLQARSTVVASSSTFNGLGGWLVVTYTYETTGTTRFLNSLLFFNHFQGFIRGTTAAEAQRSFRSLYLAEPGSLTLRQSGYALFWSAASNANMVTRAGAQAFRTYTAAAGTMTCGSLSLVQRIDSGGAQGAGITLAAAGSPTTFFIDVYAGTTNVNTIVDGWIVLNYESDLSPLGPGAHAHSISYLNRATAADETELVIASTAPISIPETSYYLMCTGYRADWMASGPNVFHLSGEINAGELGGDGWMDFRFDYSSTDAERGNFIATGCHTPFWKRHPNDPDTNRVDITAARRWRYHTPISSSWKALFTWVTYHSHLFNVTGTITGNVGTVTLDLHDASTGEKLLSTTDAGGSYTVQWYDARSTYISAREDANHLGRSDNGAGTRVTS